MVLTLRFTISALSAVAVAVVAAITLSISLTSSLSALRSIGTDHAAQLLRTAEIRTAKLFEEPVVVTEALQNFSRLEQWQWASDNETVYQLWNAAHQQAWFQSKMKLAGILTTMWDNTRYFIGPHTDQYWVNVNMVATSVSQVGRGANQSVRYRGNLHRWSDNTKKSLFNDSSAPTQDPIPQSETPVWNTFMIGSGNGFITSFPGVYVVESIVENNASDVEVYLPVVAPLYFGNDPRGQANVAGFAVVTFFIGDLSVFLRDSRGTPGTTSIAFDGFGYLLGSSEEQRLPFQTQTRVPVGTPAQTGCATSDATAGLLAVAADAVLLCRTNARDYPIPALQAAYQDAELGATETRAVKLLKVDGVGHVYAAAAKVALRAPGVEPTLLLAMPEEDVIGDVVRSRNVAIGVTVAVFVLVASLTFVVVSMLLSPLKLIAVRMERAANFDDDDDDRSKSAMGEVRALQQAYYEMNDELNRIRGFVPQAVLVSRATVDEEADLVEDLAEDSMTQRDTVSVRSNKSYSQGSNASRRTAQSKRSGRSSQAALAAASAALGLGLKMQSVTVLIANVDGFGRVAGERDAAARFLASAVDFVLETIHNHNGVLDSFHGDEFVVTFNAVRACATHARHACEAALSLASQPADHGDSHATNQSTVRMRCGLSTGRCLVGNVGTQQAKGFSTIGPAFLQAQVLVRMARVHKGVQVLASQRACADVVTHMRYLFIDMVRLPQVKAGAKREADSSTRDGSRRNAKWSAIASVMGARDTSAAKDQHDGEWLYVVGAGETDTTLRAHNEAFESLAQRERVSPECEAALVADNASALPFRAHDALTAAIEHVKANGDLKSYVSPTEAGFFRTFYQHEGTTAE